MPGRAHRPRWPLLAGGALALILSASVAVAFMWRSSIQHDQRQAFRASATNTAETLATLLNRDADFVVTTRAVLTMQPHMTPTTFSEWFDGLHGGQRQVGGLGTTVVDIVPAAQRQSFQTARNADPAFRSVVKGVIRTVPPSGKATYCLMATTESPLGGVPPGIARMLQGDWCNPRSEIGAEQAGLQRASAASGRFVVIPVTAQGRQTTFVEAAFYRRGAPVATVAERRAAVQGWVLSSFDMDAIVEKAIGVHPSLSVSLYHLDPDGHAQLIAHSARGASSSSLTYTKRTSISTPWRIVVRGEASVGGLSADVQALLVLLGGVLIGVLLFALVTTLARSRERALGLVDEKTGQLRHQALHDALTGLPNRVLAIDRAEQMLARARRQSTPVAALYVDIDGFKRINDTFGHAAGDDVLRVVGARLASVIREGDTAARLGGDEFVVLVEGSTLDSGADLIAERLLEVMRQPCELSATRRPLTLTISIGVATGIRDSVDELLRDADVALYEAKTAGRDRYVLFEAAMQAAAHDRLALQMDLAEALKERQFFLLYQPTFDLQTQSVRGVEALIRWEHPQRGTLAPDTFIPLAEETGVIVPIGAWVLREACQQASDWHREGHKIGMSVNVSGRQLDTDRLVHDVRDALQHSGLQPQFLTLEVTETALMRDPKATARRLHELKRLGVRIAIDDFGTGYSSLVYLRQFPADALKIDRSFIGGIAKSPDSAALIHTLVQLGKTLGIETLAEGIDDQAQLETLQRERCDEGQGFLFSRPLDVEAIAAFLRQAKQRPTPQKTS